jgi:hypothetical protein
MQYLDSHNTSGRIGRNGPVVWPPWSPDLTPAVFAYGAIWTSSFTASDVTRGTIYEMPWKRLEQQNATCMMSFSRPEILGSTGHSYALTVMVDHFSIISTPLVSGQMPFCSQPINSLSTTTLSTFLSSCFLLPYLANEAVAMVFCMNVSVGLTLHLRCVIKTHPLCVCHVYTMY